MRQETSKSDIINKAIDGFTDVQAGILHDLANDGKLKDELPAIHKQIMTLYRDVTVRTEKLIKKLKAKLDDEDPDLSPIKQGHLVSEKHKIENCPTCGGLGECQDCNNDDDIDCLTCGGCNVCDGCHGTGNQSEE